MAIASGITDSKQLSAWLAGTPGDRAHAVATRAALRVLPLIFQPLVASPTNRAKFAALQALRAAFVAWTARIHVDSAGILSAPRSEACTAAQSHVSNADAAVGAVLGAAAFAARASGADDALAADAAATAASRAAGDEAAKLIWQSISADADWLEGQALESQTEGGLIRQPLWLDDVRGESRYQANFPLWIRKPFDAFDESPLVTGGAWGVWLAWYRALLPNGRDMAPESLFGEQNDMAIAAKDDQFWRRDAEAVTTEIAARVGWRPQAQQDREEGTKAAPAEKKGQASEAPTKKPPIQSVEPQSDEATADDQLGRRPFAQALVERMDKLYERAGGGGFAANIHAPWGAGKTSVLLMMQEMMISADRTTVDGKRAPRWVVVDFNAWKHERRNPPWWPLVEAVKTECLKSLSASPVDWLSVCKAWISTLPHFEYPTRDQQVNRREDTGKDKENLGTDEGAENDKEKDRNKAGLLQAQWMAWKIRTDALPYLVAAMVAALCFWLLWSVGRTPGGNVPAIFEWMLKLFTAALAVYAAFSGASRVAVFGSAAAAKFYEDVSQDPLKRITKLFTNIVKKTDKPICVFIDDLDRCAADYVVDLLEGIQTSFRHENIAYIVAADRAWIRASFEARYKAFSSTVGTVGQPLGYLFLEKIFQVSTPVPGMGDETRRAYWNRLLKGSSTAEQSRRDAHATPDTEPARAGRKEFDREVESKRADLRKQHENLTREQADAVLEKSDTAEDRAAVVLELNASRAAEKEAEHLLEQFTGIVPDNPRVMKRMVNAFAMRQAIGILEHSKTPTEALARWTILEQRYPVLADLLIEHPEWVQLLADKAQDPDKLPPLLLPFANSQVIREIIGTADLESSIVKHLRTITRGSAV